jgi:hypothetical protein
MVVQALANNALVLVSCVDKKTGQPVACLCAALSKTGAPPQSAADVQFLPLARFFIGDPADEVVIPNEGPKENN